MTLTRGRGAHEVERNGPMFNFILTVSMVVILPILWDLSVKIKDSKGKRREKRLFMSILYFFVCKNTTNLNGYIKYS